jgi:hypothetical protein
VKTLNQNESILEILQSCKGKHNSKTASQIAYLVQSESRIVRKKIHELRLNGHLICSDEEGYFIPETLDEARESMTIFAVRFKAMSNTCRKLKKSITEQFGKQEKLNI